MFAIRAANHLKISKKQLAEILDILDKIDRGLIEPSIPGPMGRFLRQYRDGKSAVDEKLLARGVKRRADGAVSGVGIGVINVHPMLELRASILNLPLGEVADTIGISEELGGLTYLRMWLKGPTANAAYNVVKQGSGLSLSGDFRWSPLSRITTGEALVSATDFDKTWKDARCLKAVADDLIRPPHALEYVLDYRLGRPGLKYFRCVHAIRRPDGWDVVPALEAPRRLPLIESTRNLPIAVSDIAVLLVYCEPWSSDWTIVDAAPANPDEAFAHAVSWADFQREIAGLAWDGAVTSTIASTFRRMGLGDTRRHDANLTRSLLPVALDVLRGIRRVSQS